MAVTVRLPDGWEGDADEVDVRRVVVFLTRADVPYIGAIVREILSTITSKGQVTIPVEVRRHLNLKTGSKISFVIDDEEQGTVRLRPPRYPDLKPLRGAAGSLAKPVPWGQVLQVAREDRLRVKHAAHE